MRPSSTRLFRSILRAFAVIALGAWLGGVQIAAQVVQPLAPLCPQNPPPGVGNRDGYLVQFDEVPANPMELSANGSELWVVNMPDARVSVFDATNPTAAGGPVLLAEIAVGLDPVTIRRRPGTAEMWVVCSSSNSVFVIDVATRLVTTTIRVEHEPTDLVFDPAGNTAYVSLEASNQIAVVNANTRQPVNPRIEFDSLLPTASATRIHAEEPHALMLEGNNLYALSHLSGNGSMFNPDCGTPANPAPCFPFAADPRIANFWLLYNQNPLLPEPPDRDVFRHDVTNPGAPGTVVGWRFGTMNFDLARDPGGPNLVVSNVDLKNDQFILEPVVALSNFSEHRISMGPDATSAASNTSVSHFDLNATANVHSALTTMGYTCAVPNQMAFNAAGNRLYVACHGTRNVAVLNWPPTQVQAELRSNATVANKVGFGTQGVVLDEGRNVVYTYEQGDSMLQVYAANPTTGTLNMPLRTVAIGYDITPANVEAGRFHFGNAKNSTFGTVACDTCHYHGDADRVAWNLGDATGDVANGRLVNRDLKELRITMSLRGIEETPPFHWRGDRDDLQAFGGAQMGLLGGMKLSNQELQEIDDYIFTLSHRPNTRQAFNRAYSAQAVDGFSCFSNRKSLSFHTDTMGGIVALTCNGCHETRAFSGTNCQVNNDIIIDPLNPSGIFVAEDATQMRGTFDKTSDLVDYIPANPSATFKVPASGWGFGSSGAADSLNAFVQGAAGNLPLGERNAISAFFREFDSGIAPTTAFAWTMDQNSVANIPPALVDLVLGADNGDNDLIVRGQLTLGGPPVPFGAFYVPNPGVPLGGTYVTDSTALGGLSGGTLVQAAQLGLAVMHFIGTPVGMGYRLGIDREMDFVLDGNEQATCPAPPANCASSRTADTDGDFYPDGYEIRLGTNPNDPTSFPTNDNTAPVISNPVLAWDNTVVAKYVWTTNEESKSIIEVRDGLNNVVYSHEEAQFKLQHSMVVRGLEAGKTYSVTIVSEDPANANIPFLTGNRAQLPVVPLTTQPRLFQKTMHVESTTLAVQGINPNNTVQLLASFQFHDGATSAPMTNTVVTMAFNVAEWIVGGAGAITPTTQLIINATTDGQGRVSQSFASTIQAGQGGIVEVFVALPPPGSVTAFDVTQGRMYFQPESGLDGFGAKINLP